MKLNTKTAGTLDVSCKMVTSQVAKDWLGGCRKNRSPSKSRIKRYRHAMDKGEWRVSQPLLFDLDDKLLDGQHRLHAVVLHGKPIEFIVIRGYDRAEVFGIVDDVAKRTLAHWLHIKGVELPIVAAGVVGMCARDLHGRIPTSAGGFIFTPIEGVDFYFDNPKIADSVTAPGTVNTYISRTMCCFCHWKFSQLDSAAADVFFVDLQLGELEGEFDPIYLLRERMKSDRVSKGSINRTETLALIYKAWNAIRTGLKIRQLKWTSDGPRSEDFPEVV